MPNLTFSAGPFHISKKKNPPQYKEKSTATWASLGPYSTNTNQTDGEYLESNSEQGEPIMIGHHKKMPSATYPHDDQKSTEIWLEQGSSLNDSEGTAERFTQHDSSIQSSTPEVFSKNDKKTAEDSLGKISQHLKFMYQVASNSKTSRGDLSEENIDSDSSSCSDISNFSSVDFDPNNFSSSSEGPRDSGAGSTESDSE